MIAGSYDLDTVKEPFALKIDLTFKSLVNAKAWCYKCEGYEHYDYHCSSKSQHVSIVSSNVLTTQKLLRMSSFLLRLLV